LNTSHANASVFIIDDHRDGADTLALLFRLHGADAVVFNRGADGVDAASVYQPDLILVDLIMAGMDGFETSERLRVVPGIERTVVFAVTGSEHERDEALNSGCFDGVFVKPLEPSLLLEALQAVQKFRGIETDLYSKTATSTKKNGAAWSVR
jgi:CheY-like chemotaxis protein